MTVKRILGDFLQVADQIEDKSVDLLLTDPPYNISDRGARPVWRDADGVDRNTIHDQKFDDKFAEAWDSCTHEDFIQQMDLWSRAWFPKLRPGATFAIFISDRYISYLWTSLESAGFEPKRVITWKKPAAVPFNRGVNPVSGCEYILWGIKPGGRRTFNASAELGSRIERAALADKVSSAVYKFIRESDPSLYDTDAIMELARSEMVRIMQERKTQDNGLVDCVIPNTYTYSGGLGRDKIHPTQKPEEILKYIIELCSRPGDTVLDTFAGSGSTGIAAQSLGRNATLIERDPAMFTSMNARFSIGDIIEITE